MDRTATLLGKSFNDGKFATECQNKQTRWDAWRDQFDLVDGLQPSIFLKSKYMKYATGGKNADILFRRDDTQKDKAKLFADAARDDDAFAKYPTNTDLPSQLADLRTTLYVPYVSPGLQEINRVEKRMLAPQQFIETCPLFSFNGTTKDYDAAGGNTLAIRLGLEYKIPIELNPEDKDQRWPKGMAAELSALEQDANAKAPRLTKKKNFIAYDLCKVVGMRDQYLGTELFFGTTLPSSVSWKNVRSPSQLLKAVFSTANPVAPLGLFIVAGDQRVL